MSHFPHITEEEYNELHTAGFLGNSQEILPLYWKPLRNVTKLFRGNKEEALKFLPEYVKTLEVKDHVGGRVITIG